jgi:hypothetical protein
MRKVTTLVVGALLAMLAGAPASAAAPSYHCGRSGTITLDDRANGRHQRACKGARLTVVLHAPATESPDMWWTAITVDGRAVQVDPNHPRVLPARGVTLGFFRAAHHGTATLHSTRHVCPLNPGGPTCHAVAYWQVTIDVH